MKAITDADYTAEPVSKDLEIKNVDEYHDLYFQSDYCLLIYLTTFGICASKFMPLTLFIFILHQN